MRFISHKYPKLKLWLQPSYHKLGALGQREFVAGVCARFENGVFETDDPAIIEAMLGGRFYGIDYFSPDAGKVELSPSAQQQLKTEKETTAMASLTCPECGFVAKSEFGLKGHMRKHQN